MYRQVIDRAAVLADWSVGRLRMCFASLVHIHISSVDPALSKGELIGRILRIEFATLLEPE